MATEKRMIDPDKLSKATIEYCGSCFSLDELEKCGEIYVDAVEVVRCKDCKRRIEKRWCYSLHTYNGEPVGVADDFFCAYGKRKSDG